MTYNQIIYLRLLRQSILEPVDPLDYETLFRLMSPVPTIAWVEPGTPPEIEHRCDFDDRSSNDLARRMRTIVKGRFQGGNVGYIHLDELALFAAAYKKPIKEFSEVESTILQVLHNEGPMNLKLMKEITGILNKDLAKAAQRLQKAFIVFEDQVDNEWDRAWYLLEDELDQVDMKGIGQEEAFCEVIRRFIHLNVLVDARMIKSFTKFTNKIINTSLESLVKENVLVACQVEGHQGYMLVEDQLVVETSESHIPDKVYLLDPNDYLVKSNELALKERFGKSPYKTIAYIFKQGRFIGRLLGYFRFGPNDLEDVQLDIEESLKELWKDRIIDLVKQTYEGQDTYLKRYDGLELEPSI